MQQSIEETPTTISEWRRQRSIFQNPRRHSPLRLGFATFYLNRCNRSGIIASAGPIGGLSQTGRWKIDARFNRKALAARIRQIAMYRDRIDVSDLDAMDFLKHRVGAMAPRERPFVYLDPPYFEKGQELYMNHYRAADHASLAEYVAQKLAYPWVMSYDDVAEIRRLYRGMRLLPFTLDYTARERRVGAEVLILQEGLVLPRGWRRRIPASEMGSGDARCISKRLARAH